MTTSYVGCCARAAEVPNERASAAQNARRVGRVIECSWRDGGCWTTRRSVAPLAGFLDGLRSWTDLWGRAPPPPRPSMSGDRTIDVSPHDVRREPLAPDTPFSP